MKSSFREAERKSAKKLIQKLISPNWNSEFVLKTYTIGMVEDNFQCEEMDSVSEVAEKCRCGYKDCDCLLEVEHEEEIEEIPEPENIPTPENTAASRVFANFRENICCCGYDDCRCKRIVVPCIEISDSDSFYRRSNPNEGSYAIFLENVSMNKETKIGVVPTSVADATTQISRRITTSVPVEEEGYCIICGKTNTTCRTKKLGESANRKRKIYK